jgi:hypothetical protein
MYILYIHKFCGDKRVVPLQEYPHAQPVFDANITPKDLEIAIKEWAVRQDEVDAINAQAKNVVVPVVEVKAELKSLEGKIIK